MITAPVIYMANRQAKALIDRHAVGENEIDLDTLADELGGDREAINALLLDADPAMLVGFLLGVFAERLEVQ